jgi:hypothetical protein
LLTGRDGSAAAAERELAAVGSAKRRAAAATVTVTVTDLSGRIGQQGKMRNCPLPR